MLIAVTLACFFGLSIQRTLGQFEEDSVEQLVEKVGSDDRDTRRDAAYELVSRQVTEVEVIRALAQRVDDDDDQVKFLALLGLARAGEKAESAIPELLEALADRSDQVRFRAADALGKIGEAAVPPLAKQWDQNSDRGNRSVAAAVALIGPKASPKFGTKLSQALEETDDETLQNNCANALLAIQDNTESVANELIDHSSSDVRRLGFTALFSKSMAAKKKSEYYETAFEDESESVRELAIAALAKSEDFSDPQKTKYLVAALGDASTTVRSAATVAVGNAALDRRTIALELAKYLSAENKDQAKACAKALGRLGPAALVALPQMLEGVENETLDASTVSEPVASIGPEAIPALLDALGKNPGTADVVAGCLSAMGDSAATSLLETLDHGQPTVRAVALRSLAGVTKLSDAALNKISLQLQDPAAEVRAAAIEILASNSENSEVIMAIVAAVQDNSQIVRQKALEVFYQIELEYEAKSRIYEAGLSDESDAVKLATLQSLSQDERFLQEHLSSVLDLAKTKNPKRIRLASVGALQGLDENYDQATVSKVLEVILSQDDAELAAAATKTASQLELKSPNLLNAIAANLGDDLELLQESLLALSKYGDEASKLAPSVAQLLTHDTEHIQTTAIETLQRIHSNRELLAETLTETLKNDRWAVRTTAARSLSDIGQAAKCAVPELFGWMVREQDDNIASACLKEIDAAPLSAVDLLFEHIDSSNRRTSYYAIYLLGKVDPPSEDVLAKLEKFYEDKGSKWRSDFRGKVLNQAIDNLKEQLAENSGD